MIIARGILVILGCRNHRTMERGLDIDDEGLSGRGDEMPLRCVHKFLNERDKVDRVGGAECTFFSRSTQ